jgi:hypothetical protein
VTVVSRQAAVPTVIFESPVVDNTFSPSPSVPLGGLLSEKTRVFAVSKDSLNVPAPFGTKVIVATFVVTETAFVTSVPVDRDILAVPLRIVDSRKTVLKFSLGTICVTSTFVGSNEK